MAVPNTSFTELDLNNQVLFTGVLNGTFTFDPVSALDGAGETSGAITVTGAALGDYVILAAPIDLQGIVATAYVSAANTVRIRIQNETVATVDLASSVWKVKVLKG